MLSVLARIIDIAMVMAGALIVPRYTTAAACGSTICSAR